MKTEILKEIIDRISNLLINNINSCYSFHNYKHTLAVVKSAYILSFYHKLNDYDRDILLLSAWFHDMGYIISPKNHEEISIIYAKEFLSTYNISNNFIKNIQETILSTKLTNTPVNITQKILKDADLYHLSQKYFFTVSEKLRCEMEFLLRKELTKKNWAESNIEFLTNHTYCTAYGQKYLEKGKIINIKLLKKYVESPRI